jgi:hypothetical protein
MAMNVWAAVATASSVLIAWSMAKDGYRLVRAIKRMRQRRLGNAESGDQQPPE